MAKGRFKGWRSETTIAKMTKEEQELYRLFVQEVEEARKNGTELPEPPHFSTDKPVSTGTGKRGRKPKSNTEKKITNLNNTETEDDTDSIETENDVENTDENITYNKESEVRKIIREQVEYQKSFLGNSKPEGTPGGEHWWDPNDTKRDICETIIHHLSREDFCIIETNERFWINQIKRMIEKTPDKVIILDNWSNGDMLRVKVPYSAMKRCKISTRTVRTVSDEQRERMSAMGKAMVEKRRAMKNQSEEDEVEIEETINNTEVNNTLETENAPEKVEAELVKPNPLENTDEESDEEFESTPMNRFRQIEEETPDIPDGFEEELEDMGPDYGPNLKPIRVEGKSLEDVDYRDLNF